ncbi:MAG: UbiA family prenyltransferase [Anaerolineales bacterium]|nr:UbiA family prenyltransferase [Anaerolineales bacterium]MCB9128682.1 UbiA family prenyltransferase [Ardenticatenales bacterium]
MISHLRHLRLPFNLLLSPIYLWGVLLAGGTIRSLNFWVGYLTLHIFLYGGGTAFNSWYDQDEGPIGGMAEPVPTERGLLAFSIIWQTIGLPLALWIGWGFTVTWLLLALLMAAYSHPLTRLKAKPILALLAVALGQGATGFAAGWLVGRPALSSLWQRDALWGMASTALLVTGLYVVTQSYQAAEDSARGDQTLPVILGPRRALYAAVALLGAGGALLLAMIVPRFGIGWALGLALLLAAPTLGLLRWARQIEAQTTLKNYATAMRLTTTSALILTAFLLFHLRR